MVSLEIDDAASLEFIQCEQRFSLRSFHSFLKREYAQNVVISNFFLYLILFIPTVLLMSTTNYATESYYVGASTWGVVANDELAAFADIDGGDAWVDWYQNVLLVSLFDSKQPNLSYPLGWTGSPGGNMLVGGVRVRHHRSRRIGCAQRFSAVDCFDAALESEKAASSITLPYFACDSRDERIYATLSSKYISHPCSGRSHIISANMTYNEAVASLESDLLPAGITDFSRTRFLVVEYITYSFPYALFIYNAHWIEVSVSGKLTPGGTPLPFRREGPLDMVFSVVMVAVVLFLIGLFLVRFGRAVLLHGLVLAFSDNFLSVWGILRLGCYTLNLVLFGYTVKMWVLASRMDNPIISPDRVHLFPQDLATYAGLYDFVKILRSATLLFVVLRVLEFGALIPPVYTVTTAISRASQTILGACLLCVGAVLAFAVGGHVIFGSRALGFHSVWASIDSMGRMLVGDYDLDEIESLGRVIAIIFFWSFQICCFFILLNFITAIIGGAIEGVDASGRGGALRSLRFQVDYCALWFQSRRSRAKGSRVQYLKTKKLRIDAYVLEYCLALGRDERNFQHNVLRLFVDLCRYILLLHPTLNNLNLSTAMLHNQPVVDPDRPLERITASVRVHDTEMFFRDYWGSYAEFKDNMRPSKTVLTHNRHFGFPKGLATAEFNRLWFRFLRSGIKPVEYDTSHDSAIEDGLERAWGAAATLARTALRH